jgi:hypothetical protein
MLGLSLSPVTQAIRQLPRRYIPQFGGLASGAFDTPIVLAGDFEIEVVVAPTVGGRMILGGVDELYVSSVYELVWFRNGAGMGNLTFGHPMSAGQISTLSLTRVGSTLTATVNGVERDSITLTGSVSLGYVGARNGTSFFYEGHILSLKILDRENPANSQTFDFSSSSTASDQNREGTNAVIWTNIKKQQFTKTASGAWIGPNDELLEYAPWQS